MDLDKALCQYFREMWRASRSEGWGLHPVYSRGARDKAHDVYVCTCMWARVCACICVCVCVCVRARAPSRGEFVCARVRVYVSVCVWCRSCLLNFLWFELLVVIVIVLFRLRYLNVYAVYIGILYRVSFCLFFHVIGSRCINIIYIFFKGCLRIYTFINEHCLFSWFQLVLECQARTMTR